MCWRGLVGAPGAPGHRSPPPGLWRDSSPAIQPARHPPGTRMIEAGRHRPAAPRATRGAGRDTPARGRAARDVRRGDHERGTVSLVVPRCVDRGVSRARYGARGSGALRGPPGHRCRASVTRRVQRRSRDRPRDPTVSDEIFAARLAMVAPRWVVAESLLLAASSGGMLFRPAALVGAATGSARTAARRPLHSRGPADPGGTTGDLCPSARPPSPAVSGPVGPHVGFGGACAGRLHVGNNGPAEGRGAFTSFRSLRRSRTFARHSDVGHPDTVLLRGTPPYSSRVVQRRPCRHPSPVAWRRQDHRARRRALARVASVQRRERHPSTAGLLRRAAAAPSSVAPADPHWRGTCTRRAASSLAPGARAWNASSVRGPGMTEILPVLGGAY